MAKKSIECLARDGNYSSTRIIMLLFGVVLFAVLIWLISLTVAVGRMEDKIQNYATNVPQNTFTGTTQPTTPLNQPTTILTSAPQNTSETQTQPTIPVNRPTNTTTNVSQTTSVTTTHPNIPFKTTTSPDEYYEFIVIAESHGTCTLDEDNGYVYQNKSDDQLTAPGLKDYVDWKLLIIFMPMFI